jgi:CDP-2,3-bis-(O-geranylgeranyl)-sn-glycerol synthase
MMSLQSFCWYCLFQALVLLLAANGAPVIASKALGNRLARPIDKGLVLGDGQRLLGNTKTWRGFFSAIFLTTVIATLCGLEPLTGLLFGALTMVGDILASFVKRRLGKVESTQARGFDTVPESLLPLYWLKEPLGLDFVDITLIVWLFFLCEEVVSPVLFRLHIRNKPY